MTEKKTKTPTGNLKLKTDTETTEAKKQIIQEVVVKTLTEKIKDINLTTTSKRIMVGGLMLIGAVASGGWAYGTILTNDALLILLPLMTGCFSLLKGD